MVGKASLVFTAAVAVVLMEAALACVFDNGVGKLVKEMEQKLNEVLKPATIPLEPPPGKFLQRKPAPAATVEFKSVSITEYYCVTETNALEAVQVTMLFKTDQTCTGKASNDESGINVSLYSRLAFDKTIRKLQQKGKPAAVITPVHECKSGKVQEELRSAISKVVDDAKGFSELVNSWFANADFSKTAQTYKLSSATTSDIQKSMKNRFLQIFATAHQFPATTEEVELQTTKGVPEKEWQLGFGTAPDGANLMHAQSKAPVLICFGKDKTKCEMTKDDASRQDASCSLGFEISSTASSKTANVKLSYFDCDYGIRIYGGFFATGTSQRMKRDDLPKRILKLVHDGLKE